jgi:hypothetical protein
LNKDAEA